MALHLVVALLVCLALLVAARSLSSAITAARFKRAHGCQPARQLPQRERLVGWAFYREQVFHVKNKSFLAAVKRRYDENGLTWSTRMLGTTFINTIDPENIKTILATRFADYGLGQRLQDFGPLLGKGIFTSDGAAWEHSRVCARAAPGARCICIYIHP
jgi:hypothetical protein